MGVSQFGFLLCDDCLGGAYTSEYEWHHVRLTTSDGCVLSVWMLLLWPFDISEVAAGRWVRSACHFMGLFITWSTSEDSIACDGSKFVLMCLLILSLSFSSYSIRLIDRQQHKRCNRSWASACNIIIMHWSVVLRWEQTSAPCPDITVCSHRIMKITWLKT